VTLFRRLFFQGEHPWNLYLIGKEFGGSVNQLSSIAGPTIATYLLYKYGWTRLYGLTFIFGLLICSIFWVTAIRYNGNRALLISVLGIVLWCGFGLFLLSVSFYG
jgi:hypothetical protein